MDLLPSSEQAAIVEAAAAFLAKEMPVGGRDSARGAGEPVLDRDVWRKAAGLGWLGLGLAVEDGGVGYSLVEEALLHRELGRYLADGPFVASALGARVATAAGLGHVAAGILNGDILVGLAQPGRVAAVVGDTVSGAFTLFGVAGADLALVVDRSSAALVETDRLGMPARSSCIDPTVELGFVDVSGVEAIAAVPAAVDALYVRGSILLAAALVGVAEAARDMATAYAATREQFGRPIGTFQAVKHACAEMAVLSEAAHAQTFYAALAVADAHEDGLFQAASAKLIATHAALTCTAANVQVHGGLGFTQELAAHRYVTRAHVYDAMFGELRHHQALLLESSGPQVR